MTNKMVCDYRHFVTPTQLGAAACGGQGNERNIVDLDCRSHGYVLCDVTKDTLTSALIPKDH